MVGSTDTKFYVGITTSNGYVAYNTKILTSYTFKLVKPYPRQSYLKIDETVTATVPFKVKIFLVNKCSERYVPIPSINYVNLDSVDKIKYTTPDSCQMIKVEWGATRGKHESGESFYISMKCTKAGIKEMTVKYDDQILKAPIRFNVRAGPYAIGEVIFPKAESNLDTDFVFDLKTMDLGMNVIAVNDADSVINSLNVQWPNVADSKKVTAIKLANNMYRFTVGVSKIGLYIIKSNKFQGKTYKFNIKIGSPDKAVTIGQIYNQGETKFVNKAIKAGSLVHFKILLKDRFGNAVDYTNYVNKVSSQLKVNGVKIKDNNTPFKKVSPNVIQFSFTLTKKGTNNFVGLLNGQEVNCPQCIQEISSDAEVFENTKLYPWDKKTNLFKEAPELQNNKGKKIKINNR